MSKLVNEKNGDQPPQLRRQAITWKPIKTPRGGMEMITETEATEPYYTSKYTPGPPYHQNNL